MQDAVGFEGLRPKRETEALPASAKAYFLCVIKTDPEMQNTRNLREMHFLGAMLDHLALGKTKIAADLIAQRLKAVEMATTGGSWDRARFLELLPAIAETLTAKEVQEVVLLGVVF